jgi:predicted HD superfamily hydrolase involved in NAD metabolism
MLNKDRFIHSKGVAETAAELARKYKVDEERAYTAGILHDAAKNFSYDEMIRRCREYNIELDEISLSSAALIHAPLGAEIARHEFSVTDEEILESIRCHTVGKKNMTTLEKIIYIADMIEPGRNFDGVEKIRKQTFKNLDKGVLMGLETTIIHTIKKGQLLHPNTVEARNGIIACLSTD